MRWFRRATQGVFGKRRADALDTDARRLLSVIALAVRPIPLPVLRCALDAAKAPELLDHLDRLCLCGLVSTRPMVCGP